MFCVAILAPFVLAGVIGGDWSAGLLTVAVTGPPLYALFVAIAWGQRRLHRPKDVG